MYEGARIQMAKKKEKKEEIHWVLTRNGEVRNVFDSRKKAVKHLKEMLQQTFTTFIYISYVYTQYKQTKGDKTQWH